MKCQPLEVELGTEFMSVDIGSIEEPMCVELESDQFRIELASDDDIMWVDFEPQQDQMRVTLCWPPIRIEPVTHHGVPVTYHGEQVFALIEE